MTREMMMTQRCINKRQGHLLPAALPLDLSPRTEGKVMMIMVMIIMIIMVMVIIKMMIIIMVIFTLAVLVTTDRGQSNHYDHRDDHMIIIFTMMMMDFSAVALAVL